MLVLILTSCFTSHKAGRLSKVISFTAWLSTCDGTLTKELVVEKITESVHACNNYFIYRVPKQPLIIPGMMQLRKGL